MIARHHPWAGVLCLLFVAWAPASQAAADDVWTIVLEWGRGGSGPGEVSWVHDLGVAGNGRLYVFEDERVQVFSAEGAYLFEWALQGGEQTIFTAMGVGRERIVVTSAGPREPCYARIFDLQGTRVGIFAGIPGVSQCGIGPGELNGAHSIAVESDLIHVATANYVNSFAVDGELIDARRGWSEEVRLGPDGSFWLLEDGEVRRYTRNWELLGQWDARIPDDEFSEPRDMAVDRAGHVYVTDWVGFITEFAPDGTTVTRTRLPLVGAIDVVGTDTIYVATDGRLHLAKLVRVPAAVQSSSWGAIKASFH